MATCSACGYSGEADFRFCPDCGAPAVAAVQREQRRVVTAVFCDVTGQTSLGEQLDAEALRALLARYFERMKAIVELHGGVVEKFIGDAVMAVFGIPAAHEDDALRAVRAASAMRATLPELGIRARLGVNTGEVVVGTRERLATGDAVNVAARLEQAAEPGEILIGEETLRLTQDAVEADAVAPLELKGKTAPVAAFRLRSVHDAPERRLEAPIVGRESELAQLRSAFDRAVEGSSCELFTIVGEPGVGKSRLVREFLSDVDATVAAGRCPPYGEGITYWPVVEVVKRLGVRPQEPEAGAAIASLLLESDAVAAAEEIAWAVRKTLETAAVAQPLVVVFDDIQWGERTFLDLVEHVALLSSGVSLLLLCMARPELTERRSSWPVALRLKPLSDEAVQRLLPDGLDSALRERIRRAAGGNPLFVEEMVASAQESGGELALPATLRGLLAARLDQLDPNERRVLECAAVEGELFHRGSIRALTDGEVEVTPRLAALVRRQLIRSERALVTGEDGFRFRHLLIRDAAYEALTKSDRAVLHERLASWLEEEAAALVELDELVGYHLEQAARYSAELGCADPALAERAGARLAAAGRRALWRVDEPAAASLLQRALELTRPLRHDVHLELDLASVHRMGDPRRSATLAEEAADRAAEAGDRAGEALARVEAAERRLALGLASVDDVETAARSTLPLLEHAGDHVGLALTWGTLAFAVANSRGRFEDMAHAAEQAERHAELAGLPTSQSLLDLAYVAGPLPADEALRRLADRTANTLPPNMLLRAVLLAMLARFDEAWPLARGANERLRALRGDLEEYSIGVIAALEGDHEAAAESFRRALEAARAAGHDGAASGFAPALALELYALGRQGEVAPLADLGRRLADEDDAWPQTAWRQAQALVEAAAARHGEAERLAREAVAIAERTDGLNLQGDALVNLAGVLAAAGRTDEATAALVQALDRYERKRNLAMAAQVRRRLEATTVVPADPPPA